MDTQNVFNEVCSHLEFLGYKITKTENGAKAEGTSLPRLVHIAERPSGLIFTAYYNTTENAKSNRNGFLEWVNFMNKKTTLITSFIDDGDGLGFAGWFPKIYDKQAFGNFFRIFGDDVNNALFGKDAKTDEFLK
jgi:hypothetical protein